MMDEPTEIDEIESAWGEVLPPPSPILLASNKPTNMASMLEVASLEATFDLQTRFQDLVGQNLTPDLLFRVISAAVVAFMKRWKASLGQQDMAGLVELILTGLNLEPHELSSFIQNLPETILSRVAQSGLGGGNGVHALIGVEDQRRHGRVSRWSLQQDADRVKVIFYHSGDATPIEFFLDETFDVPNAHEPDLHKIAVANVHAAQEMVRTELARMADAGLLPLLPPIVPQGPQGATQLLEPTQEFERW